MKMQLVFLHITKWNLICYFLSLTEYIRKNMTIIIFYYLCIVSLQKETAMNCQNCKSDKKIKAGFIKAK